MTSDMFYCNSNVEIEFFFAYQLPFDVSAQS
jgi:hypothetical protein